MSNLDNKSIESYDLIKFSSYIFKKIKGQVKSSHIKNVVSILIDEIIKDMIDGKPIKINNFGVLELKKTAPRNHYNFAKKQIDTSKGYRALKFKLAKKISRKLHEFIKLDTTWFHD